MYDKCVIAKNKYKKMYFFTGMNLTSTKYSQTFQVTIFWKSGSVKKQELA